MAVRSGMGTVTQTLAKTAADAGARLRTGLTVSAITVSAGTARGVVTVGGVSIPARAVLSATDPYRLPGLLGPACPASLHELVDSLRRIRQARP